MCPYCQSTDTTNKGYRKTKTQGKRRIKVCKGCGRKFTPKNQKPAPEPAEPSNSTDLTPIPAAEEAVPATTENTFTDPFTDPAN